MKVKKSKWFVFLMVFAMLLMFGLPALSATPAEPLDQMMYATDVTYGDAVPINIANPTDYHHLRLDPANALGEFDAIQTAGGMANAHFFGLAAREWTEYTFENRFYNVDWETDIQFAEVTWGGANTWHPEAAKVYLTEAVVDGVLQTEPYYVGLVWNRIGVNYISAADRLLIAESYSPELSRELAKSELETEGVIEITGFHLPAQVESAVGIRLVDITKDIYNTPTISTVTFATYTNGAGGTFTVNSLPLVYPNDGAVSIVDLNPAGNTDGFDLDAIRVWRGPAEIDGDTATGMGEKIKTRGTWFMYNMYPGDTQGVYDLQAGNPKDGINKIGTYTITDNLDGTFTATYDIDKTIVIDGWIYDIVVVDEHLAISQTMNFTAAPGRDDNADWGVPFEADSPFYVFAHFAVVYE